MGFIQKDRNGYGCTGRQDRDQLEAYERIFQGQVINTWGQYWKKGENMYRKGDTSIKN